MCGRCGYDRGAKLALYRQAPSLREYLLVAQDRISVERYTRCDGGRWCLSAYEDLGARVTLESIDCELALAEVYDMVELPRAGDSLAPKG